MYRKFSNKGTSPNEGAPLFSEGYPDSKLNVIWSPEEAFWPNDRVQTRDFADTSWNPVLSGCAEPGRKLII